MSTTRTATYTLQIKLGPYTVCTEPVRDHETGGRLAVEVVCAMRLDVDVYEMADRLNVDGLYRDGFGFTARIRQEETA